MSWLLHIFAFIGISISSLFGHPHFLQTVQPQATTTRAALENLHDISSPGDTSPTGYRTDGVHVYWLHDVVPGADPNSFVVFSGLHQSYGKDRTNVYFGTTTVSGVDLATFTATDYYGKDAHSAYYMGRAIPDSDPSTYSGVTGAYSKDAHHVYYQTSIIPGADPATLQTTTDYDYPKDKNHVYLQGKVMFGVNPATFVAPTPG